MASGEHVRAWRPAVPGIGEVLHAHFTEHAYPAHTHGHWTLLMVDTGGVSYELERQPYRADARSVTVLPPHIPHDGKAVSVEGFDKRVIYLDERWIPFDLIGAAARRPTLTDGGLRAAVGKLHESLVNPGDALEAESRLALVSERIIGHLDHRARLRPDGREAKLAQRVREVLDRDLGDSPTLESIATDLGAHPTQVIRAFSREYGLPPHRYVTGRRIDRARGLLLDGTPPAEVAVGVGFYDQAHFTRHFRKVLGVTPGAYASCVA